MKTKKMCYETTFANSTTHDCFIMQNSQTFFQSVVNIISQQWIRYGDGQAYTHVKQWSCQTNSHLSHTHMKISAIWRYYINI